MGDNLIGTVIDAGIGLAVIGAVSRIASKPTRRCCKSKSKKNERRLI